MPSWLIQGVFGLFIILRSLPYLGGKLPRNYPSSRVAKIEERGRLKEFSLRLFKQELYLGGILIAMGIVTFYGLLSGWAFAVAYGVLLIPYLFLSMHFYRNFMEASE